MGGKKRLREAGPARGWVLPGYKYLGPFNSINKGKPENPTDQAAIEHDNDYYHLERQGKKPKLQFSEADDTFLESIKSEKDYGASIARWVFNKKKALAERGVLTDLRPTKWQKAGVTKNDASLFITPEKKKKPEKEGISPALKKVAAKEKAAQAEGLGTQRVMSKKVTSGSGNNAGLEETPVDDVVNVTRGPPNYTFASLPYIRDTVQKIAGGSWFMDAYAFRMTSVYDPRVSTTLTDANVGAGTANVNVTSTDAADVSQQKVRWFNYYAGMYKYYHVVSCKWELTFENLGTTPCWVHIMYTGATQPPVGATNEDIMCWQGVTSHYVGTHSVGVLSTGEIERMDIGPGEMNEDRVPDTVAGANFETTNNVSSKGVGPILKTGGSYKPGQLKQEIALDSEVENWTAVTGNPTLSERLYIMIKPMADGFDTNDAASTGQYLPYRIRTSLDYLVEFKELDDKLKWPVNRDPITITLNNDPTTTT